MQSLNRAVKRGNAAIFWNITTMSSEVIWKKGTSKTQWQYALNRMKFDKNLYQDMKEKYEAAIKEKKEAVKEKK